MSSSCRYNPPAAEPEQPQDWIPPAAYEQFAAATGRVIPDGDVFHPFLHEIVAVEPAEDPRTPPEVIAWWWPGLFVGSLQMMRAGVTVRAGSAHLDPVVATTSTMYWALRRRHRPASDLSHGWGHESLWRTDFRRDYRLPDRLVYNVDAVLDPEVAHPGGMPFNGGIALLKHRCATLVNEREEQWPWRNHHDEPVPAAITDAMPA